MVVELYDVRSVRGEYLASPTDGWGWFLSNSGWIIGDDATLVIDTAVSERRTAWLERSIAEHRRARGVRGPMSVALTHVHGDHANGAYLFEERGATVFASPGTSHEAGLGIQRFPGFLSETPWGDVRMPSAIQAVRAERTLDLGGVRATLRPCPRVAHTAGDVTVSSSSGVLWAGDLVWNGVTPLAVQGSVEGWLSTLDELAAEGHQDVVPGHGPVGGPELFARTRDYLDWVQDVAATAVRDCTTAESALTRQPRSDRPWREWPCLERDVGNVMRSMAEQRDQPFELLAAITAMLKVHGGPVRAPS